MGPGHSLESSDQQTACAGITRRITENTENSSFRYSFLHPVIPSAFSLLCHRYGTPVNTKICASHELMKLLHSMSWQEKQGKGKLCCASHLSESDKTWTSHLCDDIVTSDVVMWLTVTIGRSVMLLLCRLQYRHGTHYQLRESSGSDDWVGANVGVSSSPEAGANVRECGARQSSIVNNTPQHEPRFRRQHNCYTKWIMSVVSPGSCQGNHLQSQLLLQSTCPDLYDPDSRRRRLTRVDDRISRRNAKCVSLTPVLP